MHHPFFNIFARDDACFDILAQAYRIGVELVPVRKLTAEQAENFIRTLRASESVVNDHRSLLTVYHNSFMGADAVTLACRHFSCAREEAALLLQRMLDDRLFLSTDEGDSAFRDSSRIYFFAEGDRPITPSVVSGETA